MAGVRASRPSVKWNTLPFGGGEAPTAALTPQPHAARPRLRFGLVLCASATRLQLDGLQAAHGDRIGTPVLAELAISDDAHGLTGIASQIDSRRRLQVREQLAVGSDQRVLRPAGKRFRHGLHEARAGEAVRVGGPRRVGSRRATGRSAGCCSRCRLSGLNHVGDRLIGERLTRAERRL